MLSLHALSVDDYVRGVLEGDRAVLGRTLTLVESRAERHRVLAGEVLTRLLPYGGRALRVGLTGVPGAGKSTLLEALGSRLTAGGTRVAVLAVDPTSARSGGSILGDKTRMIRLARDPLAFVWPSPSGGALGGVTRRTRESIIVLEAAGFDAVIVETVGVGQSEVAVASMVDTFVLLWLPGSGDELQGIKRGIVELADVVVVHKADGVMRTAAEVTAGEVRAALRYLAPTLEGWTTEVVTASSTEGTNLEAVWDAVLDHRRALELGGRLATRRAAQAVSAMWGAAEDSVLVRWRSDPAIRSTAASLEEAVAAGHLPPTIAAERLLSARSLAAG